MCSLCEKLSNYARNIALQARYVKLFILHIHEGNCLFIGSLEQVVQITVKNPVVIGYLASFQHNSILVKLVFKNLIVEENKFSKIFSDLFLDSLLERIQPLNFAHLSHPDFVNGFIPSHMLAGPNNAGGRYI